MKNENSKKKNDEIKTLKKVKIIGKENKIFKKVKNEFYTLEKDEKSNKEKKNNYKDYFNKVKEKIKKAVPDKETLKIGFLNAEKKIKKVFSKNNKEKKNVIKNEMANNQVKKEKTKKSKLLFHLAVGVWVFILLSLIVFLIGIKFINDKMLSNMPKYDKQQLVSEESSVLYDNHGQKIVELGVVLRDNTDYNHLPENLINAFLSIEDSRFFVHNGFDIPRFLKAIVANIKAKGTAQGGSTMDMQLVKNSYFVDDMNKELPARHGMAGYSRKMQEIILAIKANMDNSKKEILSLYLNKLNFGNKIRGIQKASEYYFGKNVNELNLNESAMLAGLINLPNAYNPYNNLENATNKRNEVLDAMVYHGYITKKECEIAKNIKVEDVLAGNTNRFNSVKDEYQYYIDAVIEEVIAQTGLDPQYHSMKIYTNMEPYMQKVMFDIQNEKYEAVQYERDNLQHALAITQNSTGRIIALGGGRHRESGKSRLYNRATNGYVNPGSSIKPLIDYAPAIEYLGWSSEHVLTDKPILYPQTNIVVNNVSRTYRGDVRLAEAVELSMNTPAVQAMEQVVNKIGVKKYVQYLNDIGFNGNEEDFNYQYALGGYNFRVTPVQLCGAQSMILNYGKYIKPHTVRKIVFEDKKHDDYIADEKGKQVISPATAYIVAQLEKEVIYGPNGNYTSAIRYNREYELFAKTGTSDWGDSGVAYGIPVGASKDMILIFSNSEYTCTSWLGFDKAEVGGRNWLTSYDLGRMIREKIANTVLDELEKCFGTEEKPYKPKDYAKPDDCVEIRHILGVYPYAYGDGYYQVDALIDKRYAEVKHISEIEIDPYYKVNNSNDFTISANISPDNQFLNISFGGFGGCYTTADGSKLKDISLHENGINVQATGRCYFGSSVKTHVTGKVTKNGIDISWFDTDNSNIQERVYGLEDGNIVVCATATTSSGYTKDSCVTVR